MSDPDPYRPLNSEEIAELQRRGCRAEGDDWTRIRVKHGFDPTRLDYVQFAGQVCLGAMTGMSTGHDGQTKPAGITNACLADCRLGDDVRIANVGGRLANYEIGDHTAIENVGTLAARPGARYGNGVEVSVLNEAGGREVILFNELGAQFAHLMCLYRYRPGLIHALGDMARSAAARVHTRRGRIGSGVRISNVAEMLDLHIGPSAQVSGAATLVNGSILSHPESPTKVGAGVHARDFVIAEGAEVTDAALVTRSYIGQGCRVGRQFSAEGCLMFANCEAFHGEACHIVAGPYTVTHHKSSLLIAGMFSFFNAGSGTNQSNHMYKLGAVHEGKLERGCKTGSFAYLMWPCRVGPFSVVMGKHTRAFDASDFPFSHVEATPDGRCTLLPGVYLTTVGTVRDATKWPTRDRRRGPIRRDLVTFDVLSPFTVGRMIQGSEILRQRQQTTDRSVETVNIQGGEVKRILLRTCQKYYRRAIQMYLAEQVVHRVESQLAAGAESPAAALATSGAAVAGAKWVDVGGQLMPDGRLESLCSAIEDGRISDVPRFHAALEEIDRASAEDEWAWARRAYQQQYDVDLDEAGTSELEDAANRLLASRREFLELVLADARKEFDGQSRIGFGIDGPPDAVAADFAAVRGDYDANSFVRDVREEIQSLTERVENFKRRVATA